MYKQALMIEFIYTYHKYFSPLTICLNGLSEIGYNVKYVKAEIHSTIKLTKLKKEKKSNEDT